MCAFIRDIYYIYCVWKQSTNIHQVNRLFVSNSLNFTFIWTFGTMSEKNRRSEWMWEKESVSGVAYGVHPMSTILQTV